MSKDRADKSAAVLPAGRPDTHAGSQSAAVQIEFGAHGRLAARVEVTPAGLLAIGGMVSMILLASAEIVRAARRVNRPRN